MFVDSPQMSYGITGDLQKAKKTFDNGVNKDPSYRSSITTLACTYAEMGDAAKASDYLRRHSTIEPTLCQAKPPDSRTDDSFRKLMKKKDFAELAESLAQSR